MGLLENLTAVSPLYFAGTLFGAFILLLVFYRARAEYHISRSGGVRAPVIASNPISGSYHGPPPPLR